MSPARSFYRDPTEKRDSVEEIGFKDGFSHFQIFLPNFFDSPKEGRDSFHE